MGLHVIVGSGPVGATVAGELLARGEHVRVLTRSGTGADGTEKVRADAGDPARMRELTAGAEAIYNCANPPYTSWTTDWPPIANALLAAAEANGAVLATAGNLYVYGPVDTPMTETTPMRPSSVKGGVRARMWRDALSAHESGRARVTEVRGSDYLGSAPSLLSMMVLPKLLAGRTAMLPVDLDAPHTWTNPREMGRLLVLVATDPRGPGHVWHAPSAAPRSVRQLTADVAALAGISSPKLRSLPGATLLVGGVFDKMIKEFREMNYQFRRPFVLDTSATEAVFDVTATPYEQTIAETLAFARAEIAAANAK
ncbi:MAG TPA: NAD-dependent epimerase/dehydratase family protein [Jatrophihabitantaceae bacterium]|jgi:nucleoside-diphosphate-sugar epimerase|nr:NAD-dependent epimerase/dehydratase family protein [Jatrophihabitantaceae bacterium]